MDYITFTEWVKAYGELDPETIKQWENPNSSLSEKDKEKHWDLLQKYTDFWYKNELDLSKPYPPSQDPILERRVF
ncbi:hypothetical protein [Sporolactobacillus pectinivorans]|uniref:hypothetical protein n=1 Tax=Sporolactobacillus pectinivorans TaxID=1591408 RepID=UPI00138FC351|nr:hypothetical protein [Sporolactobacillus pectinivorans]